jgi:DNA-directed RNA polymerase specialized sigma24 family protein
MDERGGSPASPDGVLAASVRAGDLEAFAELYHRYVRHVFDFHLRCLHDGVVARELTQSTFVRAHGRISTLRDPDRVREWLFGLAYKLVIGHIRRGPVPSAVEPLPNTAAPSRTREAGAGAGRPDHADLVWAAASSLPPDLYAVLDVTARQGLDVNELADDAGISRAAAMSQLERAHEAFGRAVRDLLVSRSSDWCPGLASLVQTIESEPAADDDDRVDEHLGRCPRCRPIAERLTTPATLSETPLYELDPVLAREGWDGILEQLAKASPRATRAALRQPEPPREDSARFASSPSSVEYISFPVRGGPSDPTMTSGMMRHEEVRRYHARAERAQARQRVGWAAGVIALVGVVVLVVILTIGHPPAATTTTSTTSSNPSTTVPATSGSHPSTTRPTTTSKATTTTRKSSTTSSSTTIVAVPLPIVSSMSPTSGYPGQAVVLQGGGFVSGDLVTFTGPSFPGGTEELTPTSLSSGSIASVVPTFAAFAGQHIVVAVRNSLGDTSQTQVFVVLTFYDGTWTEGGKVTLSPTNLSYGSTRDGQINIFETDVESEQCLDGESLPVFKASSTGQPIAVAVGAKHCPGQEFTVASA